MNVTSTERLSVYSLMEDRTLLLAIGDLQVKVEQLKYSRGPVSSRLRDCYLDSLAAANDEFDRRRT